MAFRYIKQNREALLVGGGAFAALYGGLLLWKDKVKGGRRGIAQDLPEEEDGDRKKVYLITGANSGIGKALTTELAKKMNNRIYMLCRDMQTCEIARSQIVLKSGNKFIYCRPCDLASQKSVRECANMIKETENKIDGLVNNAGVMFAPRSYTEDGIETHWAVNHLSHFLLTRLLTDRLENGGRVLFMTHLDYRKARDGIKFNDINMENSYDKSYAFYQSQLANVLLFQELAEEFKPLGISVNAIYPGIVSGTNLKRHMGVGKSYLSQHIVKPVLWLVERNATEGAHTPLYMLTDRKVVHETGKMFVTMSEMAILPIGLDKEAAKKVVAIGDYWTGLKSKSELVTNKSAE